jgi:hypothetical protein
MKHILLEIINSDTSYNKSATRYLYKTHPELWNEIVAATLFLPFDSKPKQRIWHIVNDVWEIPRCPVTGLEVKWWENRYLETANRSARATLLNNTGRTQNQTEEAKRKRVESNQKIIDAGLRKLPNISEEMKKIRLEKSKQTSLKKYGVEKWNKLSDARITASNKRIENGATPKHLRPLRDLYHYAVLVVTKQNWKDHFDKINPNKLNRSKVDLDHTYSIQQGFIDNIPPYIIGHWTNLRMLEKGKNYSKGMRCDKTQDQLFEDFFKNS